MAVALPNPVLVSEVNNQDWFHMINDDIIPMPDVDAWATLFLHRIEQALGRETDVDFLCSAFNKLMLNVTSWVNRKDRFGKRIKDYGRNGRCVQWRIKSASHSSSC